MQIHAVVRSPSLVEKVCAQLAPLVRRSRTAADGRLPTERELAVQLGVSRSVVREAIKRLEVQGVLEVRHGVGIHAVDNLHKPLTGALELLVADEAERLRQLVEIRFCLEPQNARRAAELATEPQRRRLREAYERLVAVGDVDAAVQADLDFHHAVAAASNNWIAALLMASLCDLLRASLTRGYRRVTTESAVREHGRILRAILDRDAAAAERAMTRHIRTTLDELALSPAKRRRK